MKKKYELWNADKVFESNQYLNALLKGMELVKNAEDDDYMTLQIRENRLVNRLFPSLFPFIIKGEIYFYPIIHFYSKFTETFSTEEEIWDAKRLAAAQ